MGLLRAYKRLRHSRGYGVHSPSAYSLVRDVIRPARGYEYYAERRLPRLRGPLKAALLFRMTVYLQPSTVRITGATEDVAAASAIVRAACPGAKIVEAGKADLLLCLGRENAGTEWRHGIFADRRHQAIADATRTRRAGHLLVSRRAAMFIEAEVPFQITEIRF
ncbi:MAG: hypothetical protein K2M00_08525 [Muribaculaceae bacterium]|nr:hypothetical protein [Muribaculaceae bacterium]